jgi:hypothetical protein
MRRWLPLLLLAPLLVAADKGALQLAVEKWQSQHLAVRDQGSRDAAKEVRRLLKPLIEALEHSDPEVRRRARAALSMQLPARLPRKIPSWHALKACGPPDANPNRDDPNAWASKRGNMGRQWLAVSYRVAMRVSEVRIHEVNRAGAVARVVAIEGNGNEHNLWVGKDPTKRPGVFSIKVPATPFKVLGLRIELDTNRTSGWNEIDAVELVGPDGRQWAADARASSSYADR